jgi:hypothetical protein
MDSIALHTAHDAAKLEIFLNVDFRVHAFFLKKI